MRWIGKHIATFIQLIQLCTKNKLQIDLKQYANCVSIKLKCIFHQTLRIIRKKSKAGRRNGKCRGEWFLFYTGWARKSSSVWPWGATFERRLTEERMFQAEGSEGANALKQEHAYLSQGAARRSMWLEWHWVFQKECWEMSYRVSDLVSHCEDQRLALGMMRNHRRLWVGGWQDLLRWLCNENQVSNGEWVWSKHREWVSRLFQWLDLAMVKSGHGLYIFWK